MEEDSLAFGAVRVADLEGMGTLAFGPVPSRRLGRSLGINNIPAKTCSYSCVYCQVGRTTNVTIERRALYRPEDIFSEARRKVGEAASRNEVIDYLTFVPDGEPTLDINLSKEIVLLKQMGIPVAVLTNSSLLWRDDVREDLLEADLISLKVDAVSEGLWRRVNRPPRNLRLDTVLEGVTKFLEQFRGVIISETMLIDGIDYEGEFEKIPDFLGDAKRLGKAYVAVPIRPPAERWVKPAGEETVNKAFQILSKRLGFNKVEFLIGYEGNAFAFAGKLEEDLLSIAAVHPMRKEAVKEFLKRANANWQTIEKLLREGKLVELEYEGNTYYMRKLPDRTETINARYR